MSEPNESAAPAPAKQLHHPLHVTIVAVLVTGLCAFLLNKGTDEDQKYVFGILLAVTLGMLALEKINKAILVLLGAGIALLLATLGRDTPHADLEVLLARSLAAREFGDWSMGGHILSSGLPEEFATLDYRVKLSLAASKADGDLARELLLELRSVRDSFVESAAR